MTRDEIAALFARRQQAWDRLDADALAADYSDDATVESPLAGGSASGRDAIERLYLTYFAAFPDFKIDQEVLLIDGYNAAQLCRATGTDNGGFMGMAPTRRKITFRVGLFHTLNDGRIVRERRVYDFTGLLIQVGLLEGETGVMDARLQVTDSGGRRVVTLDKPVFVIGRRTAADLQLVNADVSREHAEIANDGLQYRLRDKGSRYGTFVNGEQVTERALQHGDRIRLGRTDAIELVFMTDGSSSTHISGLRDIGSDADLRQMAAILNGLRALGSGRVLEEVLTLVLDSALDVTKAERGFIMLARPDGELEFKTARGKGRITLPGATFTTSAKIPREVYQTGESRIVGDLMEGNLAGMHDGTIAIGIRHVLCVPLSVSPMVASADQGITARVIGVLYLDGRERSTILSQQTRSSLEAFATQAALAIESARLYAESAEKARIERDLLVAAQIQQALLPNGSFETTFVDLAASSIPCRTVGGDFFDYLELGARGFGFGLGDVAGKGAPAALLAAAVQSNFIAQAPVSGDPADTLTRVNNALLRRAIEARFATMFHGVVDVDGHLSYCNGGQEPPLVLSRNNGMSWLEAGGPVLGLLPGATYEFDSVTLEAGDLVVICSDGVTEARNTAGEEFGRERLIEAMTGCHGAKPDAVLERLFGAVRTFSQGTPQGDDITGLVLSTAATPIKGPPAHSADSGVQSLI